MASGNTQKFDRTFRDLEVAVAELSDRNLTRVLGFIVEELGAHPDASLADFFSEDHRTDTLVKLRSVASNRWTRKTTLQSELSRISKLAMVAEDLIARGNSMQDGSDPDFLRALDVIRASMKKRNIESAYALDVAAFGTHRNFVGHLLSKTRKYHPNRSKQANKRLKDLCEFLNLNWQKMKRDLFEEVSSKNAKTTLSPSAFQYRLKLSELPENLKEDLFEIVRFHKDASPGRQPDGTAKRRTKKSRWKMRCTDGHCKSEMNFYSLLGSFFGFCVLPEDAEQALTRAQARLSKTNIPWRKEDLQKYASWMTGLGMKVEELSMGLLFDHNLVEKWLTWSV